jgi:methylated-DNA-[protein]-cysteine S-methyltransferase
MMMNNLTLLNSGSRLVAQTRTPTPLGELTIAATSHGLAGLWFDDQSHHPGLVDAPMDERNETLHATQLWLEAYWQGSECTLPALDPRGTAFQQSVWRALLSIPLGATTSYGDIARGIGSPKASRAVGAAVGRNPIGIIVPCHRVIGQNGSLTGYAGGLNRKRWLLGHEDAPPSLFAAAPSPRTVRAA